MVWLVVVSITNLGFGDVVPNSSGGRIFVGIASILGTLLTALMIGVMRDWLEIPVSSQRLKIRHPGFHHFHEFLKPNERRILAAIKRQRFHRLKMEAAAREVIVNDQFKVFGISRTNLIAEYYPGRRSSLH